MAFPATARAQDSSTGVIRGAVFDVNGGTIGGATVALVNSETGFRYSCTTDSEGRFAFELLPPGEFSGRATAEHMSPQITPKL
jgi:protocatechuate 3,4-dioxygenase beta subunit